MSKNQKGFHLSVVILIVLVLAAAGLVGWRVFKNSDTKKNESISQSASSTSGKISRIDIGKLGFDQKAAASDPIGDRKGPYYHNVHTATSTDGLRYSGGATQILNHASVPDAIKLPSGQIVVYAVDGAARSKSGVLIAVSEDQGKTWSAGSMQLNPPQGGIADPQVILTDSGQLRLYYIILTGPPTAGPSPSGNKVYSAVSSDGINFAQEQGTRFEYTQITDPDVIKIGGAWFMYLAQGPKQIYATSSDGLSFSYGGVTREEGSVSKTVALPSGGYRQFYCAEGISSSTTTDGTSWNDEGVNLAAPSGQIICDPSPVEIDSGNWLMIYKVAT